jgi:high-affinity K+ transport system ATPase subunit B
MHLQFICSGSLLLGFCGAALMPTQSGIPPANNLAACAMHPAAGARRGLLLRGGDVIEGLAHVDTVVLDKTGTLTGGRPPACLPACFTLALLA